jgi:uncharacterized protein (TIGR03435 family)
LIEKSCSAILLLYGIALGQLPAPSTSAKPLAFDVVSIRHSDPAHYNAAADILPNGIRITGMPISAVILAAYSTRPMEYDTKDSLTRDPMWVGSDRYDIDAKVSPSDAAAWQKQTDTHDMKMMRAMLQTMLAERCRLVLHTATRDAASYVLVVRKTGAKLIEAAANETIPPGASSFDAGGASLTGKASQTTFFATSMTSLATFLTGTSLPHRLVYDKTGLTGKYDFTLSRQVEDLSNAAAESTSASDPDGPRMATWDLGAVGLDLKPAKAPTQILAIDHIEPPTPN